MDLMNTIFGNPETDPGKLAAELGTVYWRGRMLHKLTDRMLPDDENEALEKLDRRLSIAQRRRSLGLPMTSDDYELAQNEDRPYATTMRTLAGREVIQLLPEVAPAQGLAGKMPWASPEPAMERGVLNALTGIGGKYAGSIGRGIGRFIR
jgi:hypothetical protein